MGGQEVGATRPECLAKSVRGPEGTRRFYVKCWTHPSGGRGACNPNGFDFRAENLVKRDTMTGQPLYDFKEVTLAGWELYLRFLQTGNVGFVNQFERMEGL
jgi:hypothetical protein